MGKNPPKWLPGERVKETILLQRKSVEQLRADRLLRKDKLKEMRDRHKAKIDAKRKRKLSTKKFVTAQTILKHAQRRQHQGRVFAKIGERVDGRRGRRSPEEFQEHLSKTRVVMVVRAKGHQIPPEVASAFQRLGLKRLYSARLLCETPRNHRLIRQLAPFAIVGAPDAGQVEELLRTRGALYNEADGTRRFITGNLLLEKALGKYNILCIEDLVAEINNRGANTEAVLRHIAPFDFHPPRQLFTERRRSVQEKREIINEASFAAYLQQQLQKVAKRERREKKAADKTVGKVARTE